MILRKIQIIRNYYKTLVCCFCKIKTVLKGFIAESSSRSLMSDTFPVTKLSVNVNKIATLRNARGKSQPDLAEFTRLIVHSGANGITVHPRPDERHIRYRDIHSLKEFLSDYKEVEYNIEGYPSEKFIQLMEAIQPHQCTLVPDPPHVLTSNAGWRVKQNHSFLKEVTKRLQGKDIRVSLFIDPFEVQKEDLESLKDIATNRIELYTERYAEACQSSQMETVMESYKNLAEKVHSFSIGVNAGHDLNQKNLSFLLKCIPFIREVSIGHALICEALKEGLQKTIANYLSILKKASCDSVQRNF